jgi:hypothetical protein
MKRSFGVVVAMAGLSILLSGSARGDEKDATPILDAAIKALGGEEKLAKASNASWKSKGTISINNNETPIQIATTTQGLDYLRNEFELEFNGEPFKGVVVLSGKKGWRKLGDNTMDLDDEGIATTKQGGYLLAVPMTILPLKGKGFKAEAAPDEKVNGKPADVVKATGPDGKPFTLFFDKETHLPVKLVATVKGMQGEEFVQETTYSDFKDFDGLKHATKAESKRNGDPFTKQEITEFKIVEKPDPSLFEEPK